MFNLYTDHVIPKIELDSEVEGAEFCGRNTNNLIYANDTILQSERSNDMKQLLMRVRRKCQSRAAFEQQKDKNHDYKGNTQL